MIDLNNLDDVNRELALLSGWRRMISTMFSPTPEEIYYEWFDERRTQVLDPAGRPPDGMDNGIVPLFVWTPGPRRSDIGGDMNALLQLWDKIKGHKYEIPHMTIKEENGKYHCQIGTMTSDKPTPGFNTGLYDCPAHAVADAILQLK